MVHLVKRFATTLCYVTCLPVLTRQPHKGLNQSELSGLAKYLSAAGLLIGIALSLCWFLLHALHTNSFLSGVLLAIIWLCLTGGLHFDGLMDTADGIFSHQSPEKMLEVMRDSRVGNYGVMVGISTLLIKAACLSTLSNAAILPALLLCPSWARWCESFAIGNFRYLRESGMGKVWHDTMHYPKDLLKGAVIPILTTAAIMIAQPFEASIVAIAVLFSGYLTSYLLAKKFGGHTGDTYGAVVELAETGGLLIVTLALK